jgi:hypothetical protein
LGSGQWFHANTAAHVNLLRAGPHPGLTVLRETWSILPPVVWACAAVAAVVAARRRDRTIAVLGAGVVVWILVLALATERGYPGSGRFLILPAGVACVLAGAGAVWLAGPRPVLGAVLGVVLVVSLLPRAAAVPVSVRQSIVRARFEHDLEASVARAGGPAAVLARGRPVVPARLWWTAGALAWRLRVPLERIRKIPEDDLATLHGLRPPAVVFAPLGGTPPDDPAWVTPRHRPPAPVLAGDGAWRVLDDDAHTLRGCTRCQTSPASATTSSTSVPASRRT